MRGAQLDVAQIQSMYLVDGVGHLSEEGHRFFAQAIFDTFYRSLAN